VKKTDYLKNQIVVDWLRAMVTTIEGNNQLSRAALVNAMGLPWASVVEPSAEEIPFVPQAIALADVVGSAYEFNPDWARFAAGLEAAEAAVSQAKSEKRPKIALVGSLIRTLNSYDAGFVTPDNKAVTMVGIGMELPIFTGYRTMQEIREAKARLEKMKTEKVLLREGLALQVQYLFLSMISAQEQVKALRAATSSAADNRDLNERAYHEGAVEAGDFIQAQLIESLLKGQLEKACYDAADAQAHLDFVVGQAVAARLNPAK
jgi:outer membrane protein TolC